MGIRVIHNQNKKSPPGSVLRDVTKIVTGDGQKILTSEAWALTATQVKKLKQPGARFSIHETQGSESYESGIIIALIPSRFTTKQKGRSRYIITALSDNEIVQGLPKGKRQPNASVIVD
jgi:hypothetical protein